MPNIINTMAIHFKAPSPDEMLAIAEQVLGGREYSPETKGEVAEAMCSAVAYAPTVADEVPTADEVRLARLLELADDAQRHPEQCINTTGWSRERLLAHLRASPTVSRAGRR